MSFTLTLMGTGTSFGVPVLTCDCPVCVSDNPRNKRLRTSALLRTDQSTVLIDCGPDFKAQAQRHDIQKLDMMLLTHTHSDHVAGIDDLRVYNYRSHASIDVWCNQRTASEMRKRFDYFFIDGAYEGRGDLPPMMRLHDFSEPLDVDDVTITPFTVMHGKLPILGFRFNDFAYITDCKTLPEESRRALAGVERGVINTLHFREHKVHMNLEETLRMIRELGWREAWLIHTSHELDYDTTNAWLREQAPDLEIRLAHDNQVFELE